MGCPRLVVTPLSKIIHVVRRMVGDEGWDFDFVVTVRVVEDGDVLELHGAHGAAMSKDEWIAGRDEYFPDARFVDFERPGRGRGWVRLPLPEPQQNNA